MSIVDLSAKAGSARLVSVQADLRIRGRLPAAEPVTAVDLCEMLGQLMHFVDRLTPRDRQIILAVMQTRNIREASRRLAPDGDSFRPYIQKRIRLCVQRLREVFQPGQVAGGSAAPPAAEAD